MNHTRTHSLIPALLAGFLLAGCALNSNTVGGTPPAPIFQFGPTRTPFPTSLPATPIPTATEPAATLKAPPFSGQLPQVDLNVELFYHERWMRAQQTVSLTNTSPDDWSEVVFDVPMHFHPNAFLLDSVKVTQGEDVQDGTPSFFGTETILRVPLPKPAHPGDQVQVVLGYRVIIPAIEATDWPPGGNTGWIDDIIQAGEWYPALVPYEDGKGWHTWVYHPVGDPTIYPLTDTSLTVTTDDKTVTVASGGLVDHDELAWHFHVNAARGVAFLASNQYEVSQRDLGGIQLTSVYRSADANAGKAALDIAERAIRLYVELYGPYPYDSLTIAENGFYAGMEYSELVSITDYGYSTYRNQPDSVLHVLVAHEIAHEWWYGAVGNDQTTEPWLDESLAFYSEYLYIERYYPEQEKWWWDRRVDVYNPYGPVDATIYSYEKSEYFIPSMYGQAARFLRELRQTMGDDDFFAFLKDYYTAHTWQFVTGKDFLDTARRHSKLDLEPLIRLYFANPDY